MFAIGLQHVAIITWYHKYFTSKFIHVTKSYDFKTEVDHREAISQMTTRQSPTHLWLVQIAAAQWKPRSWRRFLLPMTFGIQVCQSCDLDYWCFPSWAPDRLKWSPNRWHYEQVTEVIAYYSPYKWSFNLTYNLVGAYFAGAKQEHILRLIWEMMDDTSQVSCVSLKVLMVTAFAKKGLAKFSRPKVTFACKNCRPQDATVVCKFRYVLLAFECGNSAVDLFIIM